VRLSDRITQLVSRCPVCHGTGQYIKDASDEPIVCNRGMCSDILRIREHVIQLENMLDRLAPGMADAPLVSRRRQDEESHNGN